MQNRFAALLIAALLPLLLFKWFIPTPTGQIDVWLMWLAAMIGVGLPLLYAEIGLATRSQKMPLQGMQELTRQADASTVWRSFAWLSVVLAWVIAALSMDAASASLLEATQDMGVNLDVPNFALAAIIVIIAGLLSLLGSAPLMIAVGLIAIAFIMATLSNLAALTPPSLTAATWAEWARVVVLALVSVGVGTGLYWFSSPQVIASNNKNATTNAATTTGNSPQKSTNSRKASRDIASKTVWPIWLTQLLVGSLVLIFNVGSLPAIATFVYTLGVIAAAAFLIHYASTQIASRFGKFGLWIATLISIAITALMVVLATPPMLSMVLTVISLLSALLLAFFAGWKMKISHMRKSLNFKSEGLYNLWRIAIRILTPLLIISAMIGFVV